MAAIAAHSHRSGEIWDGLRRFSTMPGWLDAAAQPERVSAALARVVPEVAAGELELHGCDVMRIRLKGDAWTALYRVGLEGSDGVRRSVSLSGTLAPPGRTEHQDGGCEGRFGSDQWRCRIPELGLDLRTQPPDAALPALPQLTDPEQARALLQDAISACSPAYADLHIAACSPRVLRYKPGSRCTILYGLDYPPEAAGRGWPEVVVAKTYRGDKGENAWAGMRALWASPLARGDVVAIAEPLAYIPAFRVLVQGPVREERTLKELIRACAHRGDADALAELRAFMERTAAGLAALHDCGVSHGGTVTLAEELAEIREVAALLTGPVPELDGAATAVLARVEELGTSLPADPVRPAHRSFRPAQVLLHADRISFIDFDGFCTAEPALDVALFLATVKDVGLDKELTGDGSAPADRAAMLERLAVLDEACEAFLRAYERIAPISRERVMLWETLDLLTEVLHGWTKVKPERLAPTMLMLSEHLRTSGLGT